MSTEKRPLSPSREFHQSVSVVDANLVGKTVLTALRHWHPQLTWKAARDLLSKRRVLVNGVVCRDESRRLKQGDAVQLSATSQPQAPGAEAIVVRFLDEHIIVVEKPAGMLTERPRAERSRRSQRNDQIPSLDEELPRVIAEFEPPGNRHRANPLFIVHRLDRDASGLLVVGRTSAAREALIQQFAARTPERIYWAVVRGHVPAQTIRTHLLRDRGDGRRGSAESLTGRLTANPQGGQLAITHVSPVRSRRGLTLLECRLETGRTNQIRIHLAELGHPILGDVKYGAVDLQATQGRLALHAMTLEFRHPVTGQPLRFDSEWPRDLPQV